MQNKKYCKNKCSAVRDWLNTFGIHTMNSYISTYSMRKVHVCYIWFDKSPFMCIAILFHFFPYCYLLPCKIRSTFKIVVIFCHLVEHIFYIQLKTAYIVFLSMFASIGWNYNLDTTSCTIFFKFYFPILFFFPRFSYFI